MISRKTETRFYLFGAAVTAVLSVNTIGYIEGRVDEDLREGIEREHIVDQAVAARDFWHAKYESLSHEADAVTVMAADLKLREGGQ
jgi:hypothetical protein